MATAASNPQSTRIREGRTVFWEMYRDHLRGMSVGQIARKHRRNKGNIRKAFLAEKLPLIRWPNHRPKNWSDKLVHAMHEDHLKGMRLIELGRKYKRDDGAIRNAFLNRGLQVIDRGNPGCFLKRLPRLSKAQLVALAKKQKVIKIPNEIRWEWREWTMAKRRWFIELMREAISSPYDRPKLPFSPNVTPFDYWTSEAREIVARANEGHSSQYSGNKIKVCSQGVIWDGLLWFWSTCNGYIYGMPWNPGSGRPMLHRVMWERLHGPIPAGCVVRLHDGNPNNLGPENLYMATKDDVARETQAKILTERSRIKTAALLNLSQKGKEKKPDEFTRLLG